MKKIVRIDLSSKSYQLRQDAAEEAARTIIWDRGEAIVVKADVASDVHLVLPVNPG